MIYTASPNYSVGGEIDFGVTGVYETTDIDEIARLDSLAPTWVKRKEPKESEEPQAVAETEAEVIPAKTAAKPRRTSAK